MVPMFTTLSPLQMIRSSQVTHAERRQAVADYMQAVDAEMTEAFRRIESQEFKGIDK